jgi:PhoP regulatory network protein YrbL
MLNDLKNSVIKLSDRDPIAQGTRQLVFEHPTESGTLIKVLRPESFDEMGNLTDQRWINKFRKASALAPFKREFAEFIDLKARNQSPGIDLPLCYIQGIVQTDIGLGFLYEKIADPDGSLSMTIWDIAKHGLATQQHIRDLEPFFKSLEDNHVVVGDLNAKNIVYQKRPDGSARYVGIDGLGSKQMIPLRMWFKSQNTNKIKQVHGRCTRRLQRSIDAKERTSGSVAAVAKTQ